MGVCMSCKMLQYDDISEGIDINKTNASKECMLCHYLYFKDLGFKFESHVCNKCHDVLVTEKVLILGVFYGVLGKLRLLIG